MPFLRRLWSGAWSSPGLLLWFPPLFWASNLLIGRAYAGVYPPMALTFWRWVVALACLLPFVGRDLWRLRKQALAQWKVISICGISAFAGYPALNYFALQTTPAATAAMLNSTLPLMIPLFAWIIARERPSLRVGCGILLSLVGVAVIVARGEWQVIADLEVGGGEGLMLLAVACFALNSVVLRYAPKTLPPLVFLAATFVPTLIVLTPLYLWEIASGRTLPVTVESVGAVLFIGVFPSLLGNLLWNRSVVLVGSAITGTSFHLVAVYASVFAFLLLGERVHLYHLAGIALILSGFALATLRGYFRGPRGPRRSDFVVRRGRW